MAPNQNSGGTAARAAWAAATPVALALAAYTGLGIFFVPMLCLYLDGRSRTWAGLATVLAGAVVLPIVSGLASGSVFIFIGVTTAAAWALSYLKTPYWTGLAGSAAGGVLGATALLGVLGAALGKPLSTAASKWLMEQMAQSQGYGYALDLLTWQVKEQMRLGILDFFLASVPPEIVSLPLADKEAAVRPFLADLAAVTLPGLALAAGMLAGGLSYHVPQLALHAHRRRGSRSVSAGVDVPPLASFRVPKYAVISIILLEFATSFNGGTGAMAIIYVASTLLLQTLMTIQALALFSFLLNRRKVPAALQALILGAALALFFWMLHWVGIFDAVFDLRTVMARVDILKAKGKQPFSQGGLDELRKMDGARKGGKNGNDGEDSKP